MYELAKNLLNLPTYPIATMSLPELIVAARQYTADERMVDRWCFLVAESHTIIWPDLSPILNKINDSVRHSQYAKKWETGPEQLTFT